MVPASELQHALGAGKRFIDQVHKERCGLSMVHGRHAVSSAKVLIDLMLKQFALIACFGLLLGCGKSAPQSLTDANFSNELNKSFANAKGEPKEMIQQATASFENKQYI